MVSPSKGLGRYNWAPSALGTDPAGSHIVTRGLLGRGRAGVAASTAETPYDLPAAYATRTGSCPSACTPTVS